MLSITHNASQWFQKEVGVEQGDSVRFLGKVYGNTEVHEGFSIGMSIESPNSPLTQVKEDGILYFIEKQDEWFFNGYHLEVDYDSTLDEPVYHFKETKKATED